MTNTDLTQSIVMMQNGNYEDFNTFYSQTCNYVYKRAKFIMKNEDDALDLTQETFVQAYKNICSLESPDNVYAWLGAICYRQGMRIFRDRKEIIVDEDAEGIFEDIVNEDKDLMPEEHTQAQATSDIIIEFIEELPPLQKAAIIAFYYDNKKIEDIAIDFDCSANTIKSRLNYAKKFLKEKVEAHEKSHGYKLHSVTPFIITLSLKNIFAQSNYALSKDIATKICGTVVNTATVDVATTTATTVAAKASLSLGAKVAIGVTTATIGVGATFGVIHNQKDSYEPTTSIVIETEETTKKHNKPISFPSYTNYRYDWNYAEGTYKEYNNPDLPHVVTISNVHMIDKYTISVDIDYNGLGIQTYQGDVLPFYKEEFIYKDKEGNTYNLLLSVFCAMDDSTFTLMELKGTMTDSSGNTTDISNNTQAYLLSKNGDVYLD